MSLRVLSKLLPQGVRYDTVGGAGKIEIQPSDVATALSYGNLHPAAHYLALVKYCNDEAAAEKLIHYFESIFKKKIANNEWEKDVKDTRSLATLVVYEGVFGCSCKRCQGKGVELDKKGIIPRHKECSKCEGTGLGTLSQRHRARIANIPSSTWDRHWKKRIDELLSLAYELEHQVTKHLKWQLYNEET